MFQKAVLSIEWQIRKSEILTCEKEHKMIQQYTIATAKMATLDHKLGLFSL